MRVLYDYQIFTLQTYGGISRYFYELIKCAMKHSPENLKLGFKFSNNAYLNSKTHTKLLPFFPNINFNGKQRLYHFFNEEYSRRLISRGQYDVLHPTYYSPYFLKDVGNKPYVITCYDMIQEIFAERYPEFVANSSVIQNKRELITNATKVIAISQQTKRDIMDIYNIGGENIEVIYLGSSLVDNSYEQKSLVDGPYLLFVGNRDLYKNFKGLIEGCSELLISNNLNLICAGGGAFNNDELEMIKSLGLRKHVKQVSFSNDSELANLYHNAISFLFPSLYEGFGIPVLEAFACKCPVIMGSGGSLLEVGGEAAFYFDPEKPESIHSTISKVISDSSLRSEIVEKASERLKIFSWDNTYQQTNALYRTLI